MSVLVALPGCRGPRAAAQCSGDRRAGPAHPAAPAAAAPARARAEHQVGPCAARASPHGVNKRMWQTDLGRAQLLHGRCMRLASCQRAAGWARRQGRRQRRLQRSACATASARGRTKDVPQWGLHGGRPGGLGPLQRSPHACWTPWRLPACAASQCARPGDRTLILPLPCSRRTAGSSWRRTWRPRCMRTRAWRPRTGARTAAWRAWRPTSSGWPWRRPRCRRAHSAWVRDPRLHAGG